MLAQELVRGSGPDVQCEKIKEFDRFDSLHLDCLYHTVTRYSTIRTSIRNSYRTVYNNSTMCTSFEGSYRTVNNNSTIRTYL